MIPRIIHFTIPASPSADQLKNIEIARELHPDWNVVVWQDPLDPVPFVLSKYWDKVNSGAQLADLIRLEVVYQQGGFYLDADFALLKNLDPLRVSVCRRQRRRAVAHQCIFWGSASEPGAEALD